MNPKRGRSSYLGARAVGHVDPGAAAVVAWFEAVVGVL
jgi:dihydroxyacetone kinase